MGITFHHRLILPPGTVLVILVPVVLAVGYITGYRPPPLPHRRILFAGLISFFCAYSIDRLLHRQVGNWHAGVEPYGFLALVICLWYITAQRIVADDRRLISLNDEMRAATRIQLTILPREIPTLENAKIAVRYAPMADVAGDLYDFLTVRPCCMGVLVADVIGHGVPAALVASMVKVAVSTRCGIDDAARRYYQRVKHRPLQGSSRTVCDGNVPLPRHRKWNRSARGRRTSVAVVVAAQSADFGEIGESGLLLGVRPNEAYDESEFRFEAGDRLLLFTDGLSEAENASGESFGEAALQAFINDKRNCGTELFADLLLREALIWSRDKRGNGQEDDITFVVIDLKP